MSTELSIEIKRSVYQQMIEDSKIQCFRIATMAKVWNKHGLTQQAEVEATKLLKQEGVTAALEELLKELT